MDTKLTVYYDGACRVCSSEMALYHRKDKQGVLRMVDIASPEFNAQAEGVDATEVKNVLHVKTADGKIFTKVEAFVQIWSVLKGYEWLAKIASIPALRPVLDTGYIIFAKWIRPRIPKKKNAAAVCPPVCKDGTCTHR